jgi:hypothetical protein
MYNMYVSMYNMYLEKYISMFIHTVSALLCRRLDDAMLSMLNILSSFVTIMAKLARILKFRT